MVSTCNSLFFPMLLILPLSCRVGIHIFQINLLFSVERRRRDKINTWINGLAKLVPDCAQELQSKTGQVCMLYSYMEVVQNSYCIYLIRTYFLFKQSKGGILAKTVDYINELRTHNARMAQEIKDNEQLNIDNDILRQQNEDLRHENSLLRSQLQQHGIDFSGPPA